MPATYASRLEGLTTSVAVKAPCRVATTAAITLSGLQTIDGVALAVRDRVLVKDQTDATQNGIWVASSGRWQRALDFNGTLDAVGGTEVLVAEGTQSGIWRTTGVGAIVIGTDDITFVRLSIIGDGLAPESLSSWDPTDATAALQEAALSSAGQITLTLGVDYPFNENIDIAVDGQRWSGGGILKPIGTVGLRVVDGAVGVKLENLTFNAPDHTGYAIKVIAANRVFIDNINMMDVYSCLWVEEANVVSASNIYAVVRGQGVTWFGNDTMRSDVLNLTNVALGFANLASTEYGMVWDGYCDSLTMVNCGFVGGKGMVIRQSVGTDPLKIPAIGRLVEVAMDFPTGIGFDVQKVIDLDLIGCYAIDAQGSGVKIGSTVNTGQVRITGGKFVASTRYGIENASTGPVLVSGNIDLSANTIGEVSGNIWLQAPDRLVIGALTSQHYLTVLAGNPVHSWGVNTYDTFDVGSSSKLEYINGGLVRSSTATSTSFAGQVNAPRSIISDTPLAAPISINGIPAQYYRRQHHTVYDGMTGSTDYGAGLLAVRWSADTKGVEDTICKSRGATIGSMAAIQAGDVIYTQLWYGASDPGLGNYMAHIGQFKVAIDGAPLGDPTELPGYLKWDTGTGLHIPGSRTVIEVNSRQQVHFPGPLSSALGPTGASWGANVLLGVGAAAAGSAPIKFILSGAVLLATPEAGAVEPDAAGKWHVTNASAARRQLVDIDSSNVLSTGLTFGGALKKKQYTVATLPGGPVAGDEYAVTDAAAPVWGTALTGGGAILCTAQWSGTNWIAR